MLLPILTLVAAYLIGSIPFGYLVARMRGIDIFQMGSGNIGATNVGRVLGRRFGILVFFLDFAKGALPVMLTRWAVRDGAAVAVSDLQAGTYEVVAGLFAFLGHLFPIYLRFRGGKGVATGAGIVAVLVPGPTLIAAFTWFLVVLAFRTVSLASVSAALALIGAQIQSFGMPPSGFAEDPRSLFCLLAGILVVVRHRTNLVRVAQGRENRLKEGPFMFGAAKAIHVLCVGLWFGSTVFFSFIVAPSLFARFEAVAVKPAQDRPAWFPTAPAFAKDDDALNGPREQGIRAAGFAVGPLFPTLFLLQCVCGFGAIATALPWLQIRPAAKVHHWRLTILLVALTCVLAGWPLENRVRGLQGERHNTTLAYLLAPPAEVDQARAEMQEARQAFGMWHGISLLLSMLVIALVAVSMVLAAFLPTFKPAPDADNAAALSTPVSHELPTESLDK